jgi:type VI secretion system protein ImpM
VSGKNLGVNVNYKNETGFFGKLPGYGDFIYRDLPNSIIEIWDSWLQLYIKSSQEQIGEDWLDIYLTSPIWRFVLKPGVLDENTWAGIVLPSVDKVGRYFPFSILAKLTTPVNPSNFICVQEEWFSHLEKSALSALNRELDLEQLLAQLQDLSIPKDLTYEKTGNLVLSSNLLVKMDLEEQLPLTTFPAMLDICLDNLLPTYSIWHTKGSEKVEPCVFVSRSLPSGQEVPSMMDGAWDHGGWQEPYKLSAMTFQEQ